MHIVVVEDDKSVAELISFKLEAEGYSADIYHDGSVAWEALTANGARPDLIVLDLVMPGLDGLEVLRRLQDEEDLKEIPVIVLTGRESDKIVQEVFELGADDYLTKPFSPTELVSRLRRFLA